MCLEMARMGEIKLFTSKALLLELARTLREKFDWSEKDIRGVIVGISKFAEIVTPKRRFNLIKKDRKDNKVLETAFEAKADFIISGDKRHILSLGRFRETKILLAAEFIKQFVKFGIDKK